LKITKEGNVICTSGYEHLSFWYSYESNFKEFKNGIKNLYLNGINFVDHDNKF